MQNGIRRNLSTVLRSSITALEFATLSRRQTYGKRLVEMDKDIARGIIAGLLATCILSLLMRSNGLVPQLEPVTLLIGIARAVLAGSGLPAPFAGWCWFFAIGSLWWGTWFAVMAPILPGRFLLTKGAVFGLGIGLLVVWTIMPLAAGGAVGMKLSLWQPVITVSEHLIYGVALGVIYGWLTKR